MINKFDYTFGVVLFILVWDLRAYYKNVLQRNLTRKQQEWVNNMRFRTVTLCGSAFISESLTSARV